MLSRTSIYFMGILWGLGQMIAVSALVAEYYGTRVLNPRPSSLICFRDESHARRKHRRSRPESDLPGKPLAIPKAGSGYGQYAQQYIVSYECTSSARKLQHRLPLCVGTIMNGTRRSAHLACECEELLAVLSPTISIELGSR